MTAGVEQRGSLHVNHEHQEECGEKGNHPEHDYPERRLHFGNPQRKRCRGVEGAPVQRGKGSDGAKNE